MDLNELLVFARVVQAGSFTAAARALRMPKSTVSRRVAELEARVGAQLLRRTTRQLSLTDVGQAYYEHCARIVTEAEQAELAVTRMQGVPQGLLRVTAPLTLDVLGPIVAEYLRRHPGVQVELVCTARAVDLVEEGFDLAVRAGRLASSSLIARRLGNIQRVVVASPDYLEARGVPQTPQELEHHDCVLFGAPREAPTWTLDSGERSVEVPLRSRVAVNEPDLVRSLALAGAGIALLPDTLVAEDVADGRLRHLMPDWASADVPVHVLYPGGRHASLKVKAFVEVAREHWGLAWKRASRG